MRLEQAKQLLADGEQGIKNGVRHFDLAAVEAIDSSALAVLLGWRRQAEEQKLPIRFTGAPANIRALAELYGLSELLFAA